VQNKKEKTQKLNEQQRKLVEQHYDLIDKCLRRIDCRYRIEYYDIAAIKLCEIARDRVWLPEAEFRRYAARSIMNEIAKEQVKNQAAKRSAPLMSLIEEGTDNEVTQCMVRNEGADLFSNYQAKTFYHMLNGREQRILGSIIQGYTYEEIGRSEKISRSRVKQIVRKIRGRYEMQDI